MAAQDLARVHSEERYREKNLPTVVHRSANFLCINKGYDIKINFNDPAEITVEQQLRKMFPELVDPKVMHGFRYTHRLDFATSGILCLALNKNAAKHLSFQFQYRRVVKYYLALVRGHVNDDFVFIDVPTGDLQDDEWPGRRCVSTHPACKDPKLTQTLLICLEKGLFNGAPATKVVLKPITGKQHQLRVHCDYIGHTIVGDYTYSNRQDTDPDRMMLHSHRLVANMDIENLDLITPDPFTPALIQGWSPQQVLCTYQEAERQGNIFDPSTNNVKLVKINMYDT
ncbi:RNA pseudouridylate synthase domain-containing protein 1-like isoform X2 [Mercenaria mercenaria]|nr:RNA pseudouridylate synthase domain-containing protein 1-like isoform X2 [Mercenaria mercenaria]